MQFTENERYEEALEGAIKGNPQALSSLFEIIGPSVLYLAYTVMKNHHDSEDAAQEALIRITQGIGGLREPQAFPSWMYKITINTAISMKKKTKQSYPLADYIEDAVEEKSEFLPQDYALNKEKRALLLSAVENLSEHQRSCVVLHYFSDMSYRQIADILDVRERNIKDSLYQARKKIKTTLEEKTHTRIPAGMAQGVLPVPVLSYVFQQEAASLASAVDHQFVEGALAAVGSSAPVLGKATSTLSSFSSKATGSLTVMKKIIAGIAVVVVASGAAVYGLAQQPEEQKYVPVEGQKVIEEEAPPIEEVKEREINTLEDLIGEQKALEFYGYVAEGVPVDVWNSFLASIGAQTQGQAEVGGKGLYVVYSLSEQDKLFIVISQESGDGVLSLVYRFGSASEPIPTYEDIYFNFEEWQ